MYHIILAGGRGTRFWPLSTEKKPKQFLDIIDETSLIKSTYNRLCKISSPENIFIITSEKYVNIILEEINDIPKNNIIIEPSPKSTAPAIYLATNYIKEMDKDAMIGVYPSDHFIKGEKQFSDTINKINIFLTINIESIVTIGINPSYPSTSYGYIKGSNDLKKEFLKIESFIEKPSSEIAEKLIKDDGVLWNSGMFFYNASTMLNEIEKFIPDLKDLFIKNSINYNYKELPISLNNFWDKIKSQSLDYAVLEKTDKSFCIKGDFQWSDIGTWKALFELLSKDDTKNVVVGNYQQYNSNNNLIISKDKLTCLVGVNNLAIINTDDTTLVIDLSKSDDMRHLIKILDQKLK